MADKLIIGNTEIGRESAEVWMELPKALDRMDVACEEVGLTGIGLIIARYTEGCETLVFVPRASMSDQEARGFIEGVLPQAVDTLREIADFKGRKPS